MKRRILLGLILLFFTVIGIVEGYNWKMWFNIIVNLFIVVGLFYWFMRRTETTGVLENVLASAFFCYLFVVHNMVTWVFVDQYLTRFQFNIAFYNINLTPFETIGNVYAITELPRVYWKQFIGNLFLLTPLGYFVLRLRIVKSVWKAALFVFLFTVGIECVQFIKSIFILGGRSTDIDDVILNTVGGLIGIAGHELLGKIKGSMRHKESMTRGS